MSATKPKRKQRGKPEYTEAQWKRKYRNYVGDGSIPESIVRVAWVDPFETPTQAIVRLNAEVVAIARAPVTGAELIAAERKKQVAKGYDDAHDARHQDYELSQAALCHLKRAYYGHAVGLAVPADWPFEPGSWKPTGDTFQDLIVAGAFIAAELDRMRLEKGKSG